MGKLTEARIQCHNAVQLNTRAVRAHVPPREDDSHTSLTWNAPLRALTGQEFTLEGKRMRIALRMHDLTLLLVVNGAPDELPLHGRTVAEATAWLAGFGIQGKPLHFELDEQLTTFTRVRECEQLAELYAQAAEALARLNTGPVRCWPHHFDIATLQESIGTGMSPGDSSYEDPYYYITGLKKPPAFKSKGHWRQEGWHGAVLNYEDFSLEEIDLFLSQASVDPRSAPPG